MSGYVRSCLKARRPPQLPSLPSVPTTAAAAAAVAAAAPLPPGHITSPHVHFPPSPGIVTCTIDAYSPTSYDRHPIVVVPNGCALPRRGERELDEKDFPYQSSPTPSGHTGHSPVLSYFDYCPPPYNDSSQTEALLVPSDTPGAALPQYSRQDQRRMPAYTPVPMAAATPDCIPIPITSMPKPREGVVLLSHSPLPDLASPNNRSPRSDPLKRKKNKLKRKLAPSECISTIHKTQPAVSESSEDDEGCLGGF